MEQETPNTTQSRPVGSGKKNKSRAARKRRRQALKKVARVQIPNRQTLFDSAREPRLTCQDCTTARGTRIDAVDCTCAEMEELLEDFANNGTEQNPESLIYSRLAREALDTRRARREESEREERERVEGRAFIEAERERLRAERRAREAAEG